MRAKLDDLIRQVHLTLGTRPADGRTDGELLECFVRQREETAFEAILARHGPMVMAVCRRVLGGRTEADDAFQATFLVLLRRAHAVRKQASLASWLYGIARRVALRARERPRLEGEQLRARAETSPAAAGADSESEVRRAVAEELEWLPEKYRAPMVLCYLEGLTNEEAARQLGWPTGSVHGRLARARTMLRTRLARRGFAVGFAAIASALVGEATGTDPGAAAAQANAIGMARAADGVADSAAGLVEISDRAFRLADEVLRTMHMANCKRVIVLLLALGALASGGLFLWGALAGPPTTPSLAGPPPNAAPGIDAGEASEKLTPKGKPPGQPMSAAALVRLGTFGMRHADAVTSVALSHDGALIASTGFDGFLRVWEAATGRELHALKSPAGPVMKALFAPKGATLYSCDGQVHVWDAKSGKAIRSFGTAQTIALSTDGQRLAAGGSKSLRVWDPAKGKELAAFDVGEDVVLGLAFSADGKHLAAACAGNIVRVWHVADRKQVHVLRDERGANRMTLAFAPGGKELAVATDNQFATVYDAGTGAPRYQISGHLNAVFAAYSRDGRWLVLPSPQGNAELLEATTGKHVRTIGDSDQQFSTAVFSADGRRLVTGGWDCLVRVWEVASGREATPRLVGHKTGVASVALSPDGKHLASGGLDERVLFWDVSAAKLLRELGKSSGTAHVAYSPDGKVVAGAGTGAGTIQLWDADSGARGPTLGESDTPGKRRDPTIGGVLGLAFGPGGKVLASAHSDRAVHLWDVATGRHLHRLSGLGGARAAFAFAADGKRLATGGGQEAIRVWDVETTTELARFNNHRAAVTALAFAPDGKTIVSGAEFSYIADGEASNAEDRPRLWDVKTGKEIRRLGTNGLEGIAALAFLSDGKVAGGGKDQRLLVWDAATGKEVVQWHEHRGPITSLSLSIDGRTLATGSIDGTIMVWVTARLEPTGKAPSGNAPPGDAQSIQGTWNVLEVQIAGLHNREEESLEQKVVITPDRIAFKYPSGKQREFTYKLTGTPKGIDLMDCALPKRDRAMPGIYAFLAGDRLRLCFDNGGGTTRPDRFGTQGESGQYLLLVRAPVKPK